MIYKHNSFYLCKYKGSAFLSVSNKTEDDKYRIMSVSECLYLSKTCYIFAAFGILLSAAIMLRK